MPQLRLVEIALQQRWIDLNRSKKRVTVIMTPENHNYDYCSCGYSTIPYYNYVMMVGELD